MFDELAPEDSALDAAQIHFPMLRRILARQVRSQQIAVGTEDLFATNQVRRGILLSSSTPPEIPVADAVRALGNSSLVTAPDNVPFCIWMAARHMDHFVEALGNTISVGGDCDTNAAIVCGIVALSVGQDGVPEEWLKAREAIHI